MPTGSGARIRARDLRKMASTNGATLVPATRTSLAENLGQRGHECLVFLGQAEAEPHVVRNTPAVHGRGEESALELTSHLCQG